MFFSYKVDTHFSSLFKNVLSLYKQRARDWKLSALFINRLLLTLRGFASFRVSHTANQDTPLIFTFWQTDKYQAIHSKNYFNQNTYLKKVNNFQKINYSWVWNWSAFQFSPTLKYNVDPLYPSYTNTFSSTKIYLRHNFFKRYLARLHPHTNISNFKLCTIIKS